MSDQSFRELGVSVPVADALAAQSIDHPFPIQARTLPDALQGVDVLVRSPTGSGKTLAFVLPIVERTNPGDQRPSALVLVPTRELAPQGTEDFQPTAKPRGLPAAPATGGGPLKPQPNRIKAADTPAAPPA